MSEDPATDILKQLCKDMGVQLEKEWEQSMRELRKKVLEKALDDAIKAHSHPVSSNERQKLLYQLDADLFP
jgi:hypothetical protein